MLENSGQAAKHKHTAEASNMQALLLRSFSSFQERITVEGKLKNCFLCDNLTNTRMCKDVSKLGWSN